MTPVYGSPLSAVLNTSKNTAKEAAIIPPANILIIDPNFSSIRECIKAFTGYGWHVDYTETFIDALRLLEGPPYDVVVIEMSLPDMLGTEAWTFIQRMNPAVTGIITTSSKSLHRAINVNGEGVSAYLLKPLDAQYMCTFIQQLLKLHDAVNQIKRLQTTLAGLSNLFSAITYTNSQGQIYEKTLAHLRAVVHYDLAVIYVQRLESVGLVRQTIHSISPLLTTLNEAQSEFLRALAEQAIDSLQPMIVTKPCPGMPGEPSLLGQVNFESCALVPFIGQRAIYGALGVVNIPIPSPEKDPTPLGLLTALAQVVSIALDRAILAEKLNGPEPAFHLARA